MSVRRFPFEPESNHPQYLWNEHEYIVRMLAQNKIGAQIMETTSAVTIVLQPPISTHSVSWGGNEVLPDSPSQIRNFSTANTGFVYISPLGEIRNTLSTDEPSYNTIMQGWFHRDRGRAIVFIDSSAPAGYKVIVMDSFNSLFDWKNRITGPGVKVFPVDYGQDAHSTWIPFVLTPGKYRFRLKGGKGGRGGDGNGQHGWFMGNVAGGLGAEATITTFSLNVLESFIISIYKGADGENGGDVQFNGRLFNIENTSLLGASGAGVSGGGGSSGEDSMIQIGDRIVYVGRGGAGGGGATLIVSSSGTSGSGSTYQGSFVTGGPGGGGAGSGIAEDGGLPGVIEIGLADILSNIIRGQAGQTTLGGRGGQGTINTWWPINSPPFYPSISTNEANLGKKGQDLYEDKRRNGGDTPRIRWDAPAYGQQGAQTFYFEALGGRKAENRSDGFVEIYKHD